MTLRFPQEIVVERFLPTVRALLADELNEKGLTQREIAECLGVTQAAVSGYVREDVEMEPSLATNDRLQSTVAAVAEGFATDTMDHYDALAELLAIVREFEDRGPICTLHEEEMPHLEGLGCDLCLRGSDETIRAERAALRTTRTAARRLATTATIAPHVPKVGTNVGTAVPEATDPTDVAAIPGRLQAVRGRVIVPAEPEFGASERVADVILAGMRQDPTMRGGINLATTDELLGAARTTDIAPVKFDADYDDRRDRLRSAFADRGGVPRICYHEGAFGIEPVTYVLGTDALDACTTAIELLDDSD